MDACNSYKSKHPTTRVKPRAEPISKINQTYIKTNAFLPKHQKKNNSIFIRLTATCTKSNQPVINRTGKPRRLR